MEQLEFKIFENLFQHPGRLSDIKLVEKIPCNHTFLHRG
jgi:hypothetical protein